MPQGGLKRSRVLWDEARRVNKNGLFERFKAIARAVLYELQPLRFSQIKRLLRQARGGAVPMLRGMLEILANLVAAVLYCIAFARSMTVKQWTMVAVVSAYYLMVRWVHEFLEAGPLVVIVTALIAIFTVGLRNKEDGEVSAYSVFNEGFQKLMGSIDTDALLAQHVGGGLAQAIGPPVVPNHAENNENRGRRRPVQENDGPAQDQNAPRRVAGKKARRRNLEQRREQRRQREAALAMGLDGRAGAEEVMAMQALMDQQ